MYVIRPYEVNDAILASSSIPEPDTGETVWSAGSYSTGTERISTVTHKVYRSTVDSNTLDPTLDTYDESGVGTKWLIVGATNKWRMFDGIIGSTSTGDSPIEVDLDLASLVDSMAFFNVTAGSINVTVTHPVEGEVYNKEIQTRDNSSVTDWWTYFTEPIVEKRNIAIWDLPGYAGCTLSFSVDGDSVSVGEVVFGRKSELGVAQYGTGYQMLNFNITQRDAFGNITRTRGRRVAKLVSYTIKTLTSKTQNTFNILDQLRDIPAVYTGSLVDDKTLAYGYHSDVRINFSTPSLDDVSIEVEELT